MAKRDFFRRLIVWIGFGLMVGGVPIIWHVVKLIGSDEFHSPWDILSSGDLITLAAVVSAGSAGELMRAKSTALTNVELLILLGTFLLLFSSGWIYAYVTGGTAASHKTLIGWCSLGPFLVCLVVGIGSIFSVTERKGDR